MIQRITFRTDASLRMGSGHVMRCLTLAESLREHGAQCHFICREHPGHLLELIRQRGFEASGLPLHRQPASGVEPGNDSAPLPIHAAWLGEDWQTDAAQASAILAAQRTDWLVIDHYALDERWERSVQPYCQRLMVIDDLADRPHRCDLLLDQNLGRRPQDYATLVPQACQLLTGPDYAMLGPRFAQLRDQSLERRSTPELNHLLITMGGVDQPNATCRVLDALKRCELGTDTCITVVMGASAPWLEQVHAAARQMPWQTEVLVNISDMAERMAQSDLAIGAAGSTAWERCSLGLPTLMVVLADNQRPGAMALQNAGAAALIGGIDDIAKQLPVAFEKFFQEDVLAAMSKAARLVTSGCGAALVVRQMEIMYG